MKRLWDKLKVKWEVESDMRMAKIFLVFAITGSATMLVRRGLFTFLGIEFDSAVLEIIIRLLAIYVIYQIMLFTIGTIFGERKFFGFFIKKMNLRMIGKKPTK